MRRVQGKEGRMGVLETGDTGSPSSGILMMAGQESLWQRKLSGATSCDRLTSISLKAGMGPTSENHTIMRLHTERLSMLSSPCRRITQMKWNRKHIICCVWSWTEENNLLRITGACPEPFSEAARLGSHWKEKWPKRHTSKWSTSSHLSVPLLWLEDNDNWCSAVHFKWWSCGHRSQRVCFCGRRAVWYGASGRCTHCIPGSLINPLWIC